MAKKPNNSKVDRRATAQPRLHQSARAIQDYGTVSHALPLDLEEPVVRLLGAGEGSTHRSVSAIFVSQVGFHPRS